MDASQIQNLSPQQREELMKNVQAQVALAQMQELLTVSLYFIGLLLRLLWKIQFIKNCFDLQKTTDKCFKKCVSSPSSSLGSGEQVNLELDIISEEAQTVLIVWIIKIHFFSEMLGNVHGPVHRFFQSCLTCLHSKTATREWTLISSKNSRIYIVFNVLLYLIVRLRLFILKSRNLSTLRISLKRTLQLHSIAVFHRNVSKWEWRHS